MSKPCAQGHQRESLIAAQKAPAILTLAVEILGSSLRVLPSMNGIVVTVALFSPLGKPKRREFKMSFAFVPQLAEGIVSEVMQCEFESRRRHQLGKLD